MNWNGQPLGCGGSDDPIHGKAYRSPFEGARIDRSKEDREGVIAITF